MSKGEVCCIALDGTVISVTEQFHNKGICYTCRMKHNPFCDTNKVLCRNCKCGKEWHPLDGSCRVGPETEFDTIDCYCQGYIPSDNLEFLEWVYEKQSKK